VGRGVITEAEVPGAGEFSRGGIFLQLDGWFDPNQGGRGSPGGRKPKDTQNHTLHVRCYERERGEMARVNESSLGKARGGVHPDREKEGGVKSPHG